MNRLDTYYRSLDEDGKAAFVKAAGCTRGYLESFLLYRTKIPRKALMGRLALASGGAVSYEDVVRFYYLLPEDYEQLNAA